MSIEHVEHRPTEAILWYRPGATNATTIVWTLRALLVVGILSSLWNVVTMVDFVFRVEEVTALFRHILESDSSPELAVFRDMLRVMENVLNFVGIVLIALFVALIVRYGMLLRAVPHGHPSTYRQIRFWAALLLIGQAVVFLFVGWIALDTYEQFKLTYFPNPISLVAVLLLVLLARPAYKRFFSLYHVKRLETPDDAWHGNVSPAPQTRPVAMASNDTEDEPAPRAPAGQEEEA